MNEKNINFKFILHYLKDDKLKLFTDLMLVFITVIPVVGASLLWE